MISESDNETVPAPPEIMTLPVGEDFTPLPAYKAAGTCRIDFSGLLSEPLKLYEDLKSGCGGQVWPAGMVLAKHILRHQRDKLEGARILEIGAGGGLVGLGVARGCRLQNPLHLTDQLEMLRLMEHNTALNGLESRVKPLVLNWGEPLPAEIVDFKPDTILAADCVYFEPAFPLLLKTLTDLLELCPSAEVYFCFKKRRRADMQFLRQAKKAFHVAELEDEDRPVFSRESLFLYRLTSKR